MNRPRLMEPSAGTAPTVQPGDIIWCRDARDTWARRRAVSTPRFDHAKAYRVAWLSVATVGLDEPADVPYVNWPAEDVHPDCETPPGPVAGEQSC